MLKKTVTYDSAEGDEVTSDFYFNFNKLEIMEMELQTGGLEDTLKKLTQTSDAVKAYDLFKYIILSAYGKKAANGIDFDKKDPVTGAKYAHELESSAALGEIIIEFLADADKGSKFIQECLPPKLVKAALAEMEREDKQKKTPEEISDLVSVAAERQADPETAVQPGPVDPPQELRVVTEEKGFDDYTKDELLALSDQEFSRLVPSKPTEMTHAQLLLSMERKNRS